MIKHSINTHKPVSPYYFEDKALEEDLLYVKTLHSWKHDTDMTIVEQLTDLINTFSADTDNIFLVY